MSSRLGLPALIGLVLVLPSCSGPSKTAGSSDRPSIILLTIDTLREDHMSRSGHVRETTPYLDRLAKEGAYFSQCYANSSWTLPSMLSMFSSLSPPVFGIKDGVIEVLTEFRRNPKNGGRQDVLAEYFSDEHLMLPEVLSEHGYYTAGYSTNANLTVDQGFSQGFELFDQTSCMWKTAECVLGTARNWLDGYLANGNEEPFFLWIHLFDPHFTVFGAPPVYEPPPGYESLFRPGGGAPVLLSDDERTRRDYDRRIRYMDDRLAEFFEVLRSKGILDDVVLVVAADHGEEFNEDKRWGHSRSVRNTLVHVPLILRFPDAHRASVIDTTVRNLDVAPTLLDYLGIAIPESMEGQSLLPAVDGQPFQPGPVYGDTRRFNLDLRFLIDPVHDRKLVLDLAGGRRQLFGMSDDAGELRDLASAEPDRADSMEAFLRQAIAEMKSRSIRVETTRTMTDEELEALRSLGYVN